MAENRSPIFHIFILFCFLTTFVLVGQLPALNRELEKQLTNQEKELLIEAHMARAIKKYPRAEKAYLKLLESSPDLLDVRRELAEIYSDQKQFKKAAEQYREVLFLAPDDVEWRLEYARVLLWDKQFDAAEKELLMLTEISPQNEEVLEELVSLYLEKEAWKKALALLDQLILENPDSIPLYMQRGRVHSWAKDYEKGIADFKKVLEVRSDYFEAKKEIALIYSYQKKWKEAEAALKELTDERPGDLDLRRELGDLYFYQNRYQEAGKVFSQIANFDPQAGRQLSSRLSEIKLLSAPLLSANYFYFNEKDRDAGTGSDNHQWMTEYSWPHSDNLQPSLSWGYRFDTVTRNTFIMGASAQYKLLPRLYIEPRITLEPERKINPKRRLRLTGTYNVNDWLDFQMYNEYVRTWDDNRSNSTGLITTLRPFKDKTFRFRHGIFYDWIHTPSNFFIRVRKREGARLDRWLNTGTVEKDFRLMDGLLFTPGYTFSYDTTDIKSQSLFTSLSISTRRFSLIASGSYGWDSENFLYKSLGSYFSWKF